MDIWSLTPQLVLTNKKKEKSPHLRDSFFVSLFFSDVAFEINRCVVVCCDVFRLRIDIYIYIYIYKYAVDTYNKYVYLCVALAVP